MQHKDSSLAHNSGSLAHNSTTLRHKNASLRHNVGGIQPLIDELTIDTFLQPSSGNGPGWDAVTETTAFNLTGTGGYATGDGGQELVTLTGSDALNMDAAYGLNTYWRELHADMQFYIGGYVDPDGDTGTFQVDLETTNIAAAGYRARINSEGTGGQIMIHDGTSQALLTPNTFSDWSNTRGNMWLVIFNISGGYMELWTNNRTNRYTAQTQRADISGLSFPASSSPRANTIAPRVLANGNQMLFSGTGLPTDDQIERLMQHGRGLSWDNLNAEVPNYIKAWRVTPGTDGDGPFLRVIGKATQAPILELYADVSQTEKGSLVDTTTTPVTLDAYGWFDHKFDSSVSALSFDTLYQIHGKYASGKYDRRRIRSKTLPDTIDGFKMGFGSCWKFDPALAFTNNLSLEAASLNFIQEIIDTGFDVFTTVGDEGYYDDMATDLSLPVPMESLADRNTVHDYIWGNRIQIENLFNRLGIQIANFSDHDYLENDVFGADTTAANITAAQAHWTQRTGGTFPLAPDNMYTSWTMPLSGVAHTPGITFIAMDTRTEAETGVQLTSVAQRAQMQTDATAAVGRGDLIVLCTEFPWDEGETPSPAASWNNFVSERENIFDRLATAGVTNKIICDYGDQHAGGVDLQGTSQGGWDGGLGAGTGTVLPVCILSSRMNHSFGGSAAGATTNPDYYDSGVGHFMEVQIAQNLTQLDITVIPHEKTVTKTAIGPRTVG